MRAPRKSAERISHSVGYEQMLELYAKNEMILGKMQPINFRGSLWVANTNPIMYGFHLQDAVNPGTYQNSEGDSVLLLASGQISFHQK